MPDISMMPLSGMNTVAEDAELHRGGREPRHFLRDAVNVNLTPAGKADLRPGIRQVTPKPYRNIWQSSLHRDTFATFGDQWVRLDPLTWEHEPLATIGEGEAFHAILNNQVVVSAPAGLFVFNGSTAKRLTLETPAAPMLALDEGSLTEGTYGAAVSWLRDGQESAVSELAQMAVPNGSGLSVTFPMSLDPTVTGIRLYLTEPNGGELRRHADYPVATPSALVPSVGQLGAPAQFRYLSRMPTGKYLAYWRGRLVTAHANVLRFSEALAYHLHDERHGFVLMPQRITFVQPVSGGLWVGQSDHVAFLQGSSPDALSVVRKASQPPVPGSAIPVNANDLGGDLAEGGDGAALWLAGNGYVVGTAAGSLIELHRGVMAGITANHGTSVVLDRRLLTAVV